MKYTQERLQEAVNNSESFAGVLRYLGLRQAGGTQVHIAKCIRKFGIDTSHFTGARWNKGKTYDEYRKSIDKILVRRVPGSNREKRAMLLRAMLASDLPYKCRCGNIGEWQGEPILLEIDHIDGDWLNNELNNLRFLCPNCHSQEKHSNMPHKYRIV